MRNLNLRQRCSSIYRICKFLSPFYQSFLGYRPFHDQYHKKNKAVYWSTDWQEFFELFKEYFTTIPIFDYFEFEKECMVETDVYNNVFAKVLFQYNNNGLLYPTAFFSYKYSPGDINYEINDKELPAIIDFSKKDTLCYSEPNYLRRFSQTIEIGYILCLPSNYPAAKLAKVNFFLDGNLLFGIKLGNYEPTQMH